MAKQPSPLWQYIARLRKSKGITQDKLAELSGISSGTIANLESGIAEDTKTATVQKVAQALGESVSSLYIGAGIDEPITKDKSIDSIFSEALRIIDKQTTVEIPVFGIVHAGTPTESEPICCDIELDKENLVTVLVPKESLRQYNIDALYALLVKGESMRGKGIDDGDFILIQPGVDTIIDGKIYVVDLPGEGQVLRQLYKQDGYLRLVASNDEYKDILAVDVKIIGRAVKGIKELDL